MKRKAAAMLVKYAVAGVKGLTGKVDISGRANVAGDKKRTRNEDEDVKSDGEPDDDTDLSIRNPKTKKAKAMSARQLLKDLKANPDRKVEFKFVD